MPIGESGGKPRLDIGEAGDLDGLDLNPEVKTALRTNSFFRPLPCVRRVVFIATPHRGSYLASGFVRRIARRFMKLPEFIADTSADFLKLKEQLELPSQVRALVPTSLDGMSPRTNTCWRSRISPWLPGSKPTPSLP